MNWLLRKAELSDREALQELILHSATELQSEVYTDPQIIAAIGPVFGVDEQMIEDKTYFVVEQEGRPIGCGGWSYREALFGGRSTGSRAPRRLNPATDAAKIRAFFVDPDFARQGIASCIMQACEEEIVSSGFHRGEISATLVGEPLYKKFGYHTTGSYEIELEAAPPLPVVRMEKTYGGQASAGQA